MDQCVLETMFWPMRLQKTLLLCSKNTAHVATFWWGATKHERLFMAPVVYGHPTLMTLESLLVAPPNEISTVLTPCWNCKSVRLKVVGGAYDLLLLLLCLSFSGSSSGSSTLVEGWFLTRHLQVQNAHHHQRLAPFPGLRFLSQTIHVSGRVVTTSLPLLCVIVKANWDSNGIKQSTWNQAINLLY